MSVHGDSRFIVTSRRHGYPEAGVGEVLAIAVTWVWVLVLMVRGRRPAAYWTLAAAVSVTAGLGVWFALVAPMNAALSGWTPETLPAADWTSYRNQWETGHAVHAALFGLGFGAPVVASWPRSRTRRPNAPCAPVRARRDRVERAA